MPAETEQVQRLLVVPGTRAFRIEAGGPPRRVTVSDGTVSWDEVAPGEFVRHPGQRLPWEMAALLDPSWLAGYDWGTPARGTHAGREVLSLHVTPRAGFAGPRVAGLLPSDLDVVIDAAFGFLHRLVGLYRDEPYQVVELLDLDLGPTVGAGDFRVDESQARVFSPEEWRRRQQPALPRLIWRSVVWRYRRRRRRL